MRYSEAMTTTKSVTISLRVTPEWLARVTRAAELESKDTGYAISRNMFIEAAVDDAVSGLLAGEDDAAILRDASR